MSECVDLRKAFPGLKTRKTEDHIPGYRIDPWNIEVPCRHGAIYPWGGEWLCAYTAKPQVGGRLKRLSCVEEWQYCSTETTVRFRIEEAERVFAVMKPYVKRRISLEHRRKLHEGWLRSRCRKPPRPSERAPRQRRSSKKRTRPECDRRPAGTKTPSEK